jgi:tetratricopeptide (TPR) repeat protein
LRAIFSVNFRSKITQIIYVSTSFTHYSNGGEKMKTTWIILALILFIVLLIPITQAQQTSNDWIENGNDLRTQGKYHDAFMAYENATEGPTENTTEELANSWYELGNAFLDSGDHSNASRCYEHAIGLDPTKFYWCNYGYTSKIGGPREIWLGVSPLCRNITIEYIVPEAETDAVAEEEPVVEEDTGPLNLPDSQFRPQMQMPDLRHQ